MTKPINDGCYFFFTNSWETQIEATERRPLVVACGHRHHRACFPFIGWVELQVLRWRAQRRGHRWKIFGHQSIS